MLRAHDMTPWDMVAHCTLCLPRNTCLFLKPRLLSLEKRKQQSALANVGEINWLAAVFPPY
jgi:hypothetical protein